MINQSKYLNKKIYIAGHTGMVGSAITNELKNRSYKNLVLKNFPGLDLTRQEEVEKFFETDNLNRNCSCCKSRRHSCKQYLSCEFIYDNLMIEANLIHNAHKAGVEKLIFLEARAFIQSWLRSH